MKLIPILLLSACCFAPSAFSDDAAEKEAERLLSTMGMEGALQQSISQMLDIQLQQNPALSPYKGVMMLFFKKHMSYESLKPEMVEIYVEAFTAKELKKINEFYETDVGKKTLEKMPLLMAKGGQLGMQRVQQNAKELESMIEAEAQRIKALQEKKGS